MNLPLAGKHKPVVTSECSGWQQWVSEVSWDLHNMEQLMTKNMSEGSGILKQMHSSNKEMQVSSKILCKIWHYKKIQNKNSTVLVALQHVFSYQCYTQ